jgi:hypothetical protein
MPKKVFWPVTLVVMGLIFMASNLGLLPSMFWNLWPIILLVVGLGGLVTADRDEWYVDTKKMKKKTASKKKKPTKKKKAGKKK